MSSNGESKYVIFSLNEEYYGIPINNVLSIEKTGETTRIPNAPEYIDGVINLRGEVIPIIRLKSKLGMEGKAMGKNSRIIVVKEDEIVVGLIVDSSSEVLEIDKEDIDKPPTAEENKYIEYISGIGKASERLIILLNLSKILEN
ncbi:chemotaxis protein CheW [Clostridium sp. Cult2]|uniref:chemotaxis protein CheW n=1 Tax=Clostridium sp. Cult2 TaxID=2079003 RepID=UPI001F324F5F|nr:chemotaxis protein CheW [Clostridium sp. Cult2]MCF6464714.1 chemotaxis protein CheW [Clostridium sp. Cult2]